MSLLGPGPLIGHRVRAVLRASELVVFEGRKQVARRERAVAPGSQSLVLDHYLEVLVRKPGALRGATALGQARTAGTFTSVHEAYAWDVAEVLQVGRRLRELRRERDLTLADVASASGLTAGYLSRVETGSTAPSLTALSVVAGALGVETAAFFPDLPKDAVQVSRSADPDHFTIAPNAAEEYVVLNARAQDGEFTALIACHLPGASLQRFRHLGEEHALVLEGRISVGIDDQEYELGPGQWLHFPSGAVHTGAVLSGQPARVLWLLRPGLF